MDFTSEIGDQIVNAYANENVKPHPTDPAREFCATLTDTEVGILTLRLNGQMS